MKGHIADRREAKIKEDNDTEYDTQHSTDENNMRLQIEIKTDDDLKPQLEIKTEDDLEFISDMECNGIKYEDEVDIKSEAYFIKSEPEDEEFESPRNSEIHTTCTTREIDTGEKPYTCDVCHGL
jgi:phage terminase small subunit